MIDLSKNDVVDAVFLRYVESYKCTTDLTDFMPERDIDSFLAFLRKNMLKDFKRVNKESRKLRREKVREFKRLTRNKKAIENLIESADDSTLPVPTSENLPAENTNE